MNSFLRKFSALACAATLLALPGASLAQSTDTLVSGIRVHIDSARITNLNCSRRPFGMENTKFIGRRFPYMARGMVAQGFDPRSIFSGLISMAIMVPMAVLAVPLDLVASPFRRRCAFELGFRGYLDEWAGQRTPGVSLAAEGRNLTRRGMENVSEPVFYTARAATTSDENGGYKISLKGVVGRSKDFDIAWKVKGNPAASIRIRKKGRKFALEGIDSGFGTGVYEIRSREIIPTRKTK